MQGHVDASHVTRQRAGMSIFACVTSSSPYHLQEPIAIEKTDDCCVQLLLNVKFLAGYLGAPGMGPQSTATSFAAPPAVAFARLYMATRLEEFHPPVQLLPIVTL